MSGAFDIVAVWVWSFVWEVGMEISSLIYYNVHCIGVSGVGTNPTPGFPTAGFPTSGLPTDGLPMPITMHELDRLYTRDKLDCLLQQLTRSVKPVHKYRCV